MYAKTTYSIWIDEKLKPEERSNDKLPTLTTTMIQNSSIELHTAPLDTVDVDPTYHYGILQLKIGKIPICDQKKFILFVVDRSGSMADVCSDGNTKLHHISFTLKNMIEYFSKNATNVHIQVQMFDHSIDTLIPSTLVTPENKQNLLDMVDQLETRGETNIELALRYARKEIAKIVEDDVVHIFMTDGDATAGVKTHSLLADLICEDYANIFIGFGSGHNSKMLQKFSEKRRAEYRFISSAEKAGLVYGEILHRILYAAIEDAIIEMENGEIYDWKSNSWQSQIVEDCIDSEAEKTYNIRTRDYDGVSAKICGKTATTSLAEEQLLDTVVKIPDLISFDDVIIPNDLTPHLFRQRTQELLYECRNLYESRGHQHYQLKTKMRGFFQKLRKYMETMDLVCDPFMEALCQDISIAYQNMGTDIGRMYSSARQAAQGRQDTYSVAYEEYTPPMRHFNQRISSLSMNDESLSQARFSYSASSDDTEIPEWIGETDDDDDDIDDYIQSQTQTHAYAYASPGRLHIMSEISQTQTW